MRPIVWLASFPKSGNTWLRLLLANMFTDSACDINDMGRLSGMASARPRFDDACLVASGLLSHDECDRMRPALYRHAAQSQPMHDDPLGHWHLIKTHDAWTYTTLGEPLLGGAGVVHTVVLIVRDPRDVVASLANHIGGTVEEAVAMMADPASALAGKTDRQPGHLRQQLLGWSGYNASWLNQCETPVHVLRYEDLQADTAGALGTLLDGLGMQPDPAQLERAAERSAFERLQAQEAAGGFREAPVRMTTGRFFRSGRSGGWREELSDALRARIERDHGAMMRQLGYLPDDPA